MAEFVRNNSVEFSEYYIKTYAAKNSQAALPLEVITKFILLLDLMSILWFRPSIQQNCLLLTKKN